MSEHTAENDVPVANGHRWPCAGFYNGNHHTFRTGAWSCICVTPPGTADQEADA